jgi:surfeit locus 1 family protein
LTDLTTSPPRGSALLVSLAALIVFAVLVSLGLWQVERLQWKEALIARIEARIHGEPGPLPASPTWAGLKPLDYDYSRVRVTGRLDPAREALIFRGSGKVGKGPAQPGYWIMAPLLLADGSSLLINRGFAPLANKEAASRPDPQRGREVTLTGLLRAPEDRNLFTPADNAAKAEWYTRDPLAIAAALGLPNPAPFSLDEDAHTAAPGLPAGGATVFDIPNHPLAYAGTWFGLAGTLVGVFGYFMWRRRRG